jgi:hypothetical protein
MVFRRWLVVTSLVCAAVASACAHAGIDHAKGWQVIETPNFRLYTGTNHQFWKEPLAALERNHALLASSFFRDVQMPVIDVLFLERYDFEETFKGDAVALASAPGEGFGRRGLLVVDNDLRVAGPELSHLFVQAKMPGAPWWFHDGFADYVRPMRRLVKPGAAPIGCFGFPTLTRLQFSNTKKELIHTEVQISEIKEKRDRYVPLATLFRTPWAEYARSATAVDYKNTGRALIDFIIHGEDGAHASKMSGVVQQLGAGDPPQQILAAAFPDTSLEDLAARIARHEDGIAAALAVSREPRGPCPLVFPIPPERTVEPRPSVRGEVQPAEMQALLDWLRRLPRRELGYPRWYPSELVTTIK